MNGVSISESANFLKARLKSISVDAREKELVAIYVALRTVEGDCDKAQGTIRTVASAWIIALLGGLGVLFQNESTLGVDRAIVLRQSLLLAVTLGLISLWYVDQRVYQRLLHSVFAAGCWLESEFPNILPPIRLYMYNRNLEITKIIGRYYKWPIYMILMGSFIHWITFYQFALREVGPLTGIVVAQFIAVAGARAASEQWPDLPSELPPEARR